VVQIQGDILVVEVLEVIGIQMGLEPLVEQVAAEIQREDLQITELERQVNFPQEVAVEHQLHTRQVLLEQTVVPES